MKWWQRLRCKHPVLFAHTYVKFLPNNTYIMCQCTTCGRNLQFNLGNISRQARGTAVVNKLASRGYEFDPTNKQLHFRKKAAV